MALSLTVLDGVTTTSAVPQNRATGTIVCVAKASLVDGETVTIQDDQATYVFEFDVAGDGVSAGNIQVNVSTDTTADDVGVRLNTAINNSAIRITSVTDAAAGTTDRLILRADKAGTGFNNTITETVAAAGFTVSGMSGGSLSGVSLWKETPDGQGLWRGTDRGIIKVSALVKVGQAGSVQLRLWGSDKTLEEFAPLGVGADASKATINAGAAFGETGTDRIDHAEIVTGLYGLERVYLQRVTMTNIASLTAVILPGEDWRVR